jgi:hypothetical protein
MPDKCAHADKCMWHHAFADTATGPALCVMPGRPALHRPLMVSRPGVIYSSTLFTMFGFSELLVTWQL